MRTKLNIHKLNKMKQERMPVAWVTAYDYPLAHAAEQAEIDMILVGDSGGMVQLGYETTNPVTMNEMITLARAARRGAPSTFIIGDMPQGSYEATEHEAIHNALRFIKEAGCDAIKCEGGKRMGKKIKAMTDAGVLVMGHLGLTPQSTGSFGGYRVQAKNRKSFEETLEDALHLQECGVFSILLEAMPAAPAGQIARQLDIPIYGIGAGGHVDGQLVIMHDLLGLYQPFRPYFAKGYIPEVIQDFMDHIEQAGDLRQLGREERKDGVLHLAQLALKRYVDEVKANVFPGEEYTYPIKDEELAELKTSPHWK